MINRRLILGDRSPARIYITSPTFGIDLSVPWLSANFRQDIEEGMFFSGVPLTRRGMLVEERFSLEIEFGLDERGLMLHQVCDPREYGRGKVFLLDDKIPQPPERPIWLPPGCWECAYCATTQNSELLQCRGCGAPRIGEAR